MSPLRPRRRVPFATLALVGAMSVAFALDVATRPRVGLGPEELPARFVLLGDGPAPWQLVTWAFVHANAEHLRGNAVGLLLFGAACERHLGPGALAASSLLACVAVAAAFVCVDGRDLYGASGLVAALTSLAFALACTRADVAWARVVVGLSSLGYALAVDVAPWLRGAPGPGLCPHALGYATGIALAFAHARRAPPAAHPA